MANVNSNMSKALATMNTLRLSIENFPAQCKYPHTEGFYLESSFRILNEIQGSLRIYPRGLCDNDKNWLTMYIGLETKPNEEIYCRLEVNILTVKGTRVILPLTEQYQLIFSSDFMWNTVKVAPVEILVDPVQGFLLPNGGLHIGLIISTHVSKIPNRRLSQDLDQHTRSKIMKILKQNTRTQNHDVEFMVGLNCYFVHRAVLVCSPTFRSMFRDMGEPSETFIRLPCISAECFEDLLIDCYASSSRFCKQCFSYRASGDAICCEIVSWRRRM